MKTILIIISFLFIFSTNASAFTYTVFWCDNERIEVGASISIVAMTCGKPDYSDEEVKVNKSTSIIINDKGRGSFAQHETVKERRLKYFFYDCGDYNFVYKLTFEQGTLKIIESTSQGTYKSSRSCNAQ